MHKKREYFDRFFIFAAIFFQASAILAQAFFVYSNRPLVPFWVYSLRPAFYTWSNEEIFSFAFFLTIIFMAIFAVIGVVLIRFKECRKNFWISGGILVLIWYSLFISNLFIHLPQSFRFVVFGLATAQVVIAIFLLCSKREDNPILPIQLIFLVTIPNRLLTTFYLYDAWCVCYSVVMFCVLVWLSTYAVPRLKKNRKLLYVIAVICGLLLALWNLTTPKKVSYGYHIGFAEIQFGKINGDKFPDLFTCGYIGMAYGNPAWFIGRKNHFDDWNNEQRLTTSIGQQTACLVDLDNDGDMDIFASTCLINDNGKFDKEIVMPSEIYSTCVSRERRFSIQSAPLTQGDPFSEIILYDGYETIIGVCRESYDWNFFKSNSKLLSVIDNSNPSKPVLIILNTPANDVLNLLKKEKIPHRIVELDLKNKLWNPVFMYKDINSDGEKELLVWSISGDNDPNSIASEVFVCKEIQNRFKSISSFKTGGYRENPYNGYYSYPEFKFADFDKDGKIDFIGDDGWIYRQMENFKFKKWLKVDLRKNREAIHLYACDINADGFPDVISSYQPFSNIKMGPIF